MKVRRRVIKRNDASNGSTATRAPSAVDAVSPASAVSSITAPSPAPKFPPPKMKQIRRTTQGAQPYSHPMAPSINQKRITQQSNRQWERVAPGDDGQGSFICPTRPIMHEFRFAKLAERGGRYCIATSKNETQSTWWFEFAQGMHGLGGTHPSGNVRACEPRHPQFLQ